jgi:hypothetical protein
MQQQQQPGPHESGVTAAPRLGPLLAMSAFWSTAVVLSAVAAADGCDLGDPAVVVTASGPV